MGFNCDFCGKERSMVYCRSDSACLCLSCDRNVHSANALSKRHSRTLICERCSSQPALVRCSEERISLCQNCDWMGHGASTSANHKRQTINCYSGCPSAAELSSLWSFALEFPSLGESCEQEEMGLMSIAENSNSDWDPPKSTYRQNMSVAVEVVDAPDPKSTMWAGTISMPDLSAAEPATAPPPKICCPVMKDPANFEEDNLYDALDMDEMDLNLENYEELFGNGGMDSLFATKDMSAADSNCQGTVPAEVSSGGLVNVQPACSTAASADSMMSSKTEPIQCFTSRPAHSSMSFSGVTGESSAAADYQDCGASLLLIGEPPWCPPCPDMPFPSANRSDAVIRYKEKKKTRKFDKTVRYASRKARADVRRRVKGRFVKAGEAYDYDPLSPTRSY